MKHIRFYSIMSAIVVVLVTSFGAMAGVHAADFAADASQARLVPACPKIA
jgi:hypothetical protein